MLRTLLFAFLLSFCYVPAKAQYVGQSRTYIIKQFPACKITKNISEHLQFDCDGLEVLCYLDNNDLCIFQGMEVRASDWNNLQVSLVWNNASCAEKSKMPILSSTVSSPIEQEVMVYKQREKTFYFFDCDFQGNKGEKKSWAYYKP
jgi:hypothetical protein